METEKQVKKTGRKLYVGPIGKVPKESINQEIDRTTINQEVDKSAMYQEVDKSAMYQEIDRSNMYKKIDKRETEQRREEMLNQKVCINETVNKGL